MEESTTCSSTPATESNKGVLSALTWGTFGRYLGEIAWDENSFRKPHLSTFRILKVAFKQDILILVVCWICQFVNFWTVVDLWLFVLLLWIIATIQPILSFLGPKLQDGKNTWWTYCTNQKCPSTTWDQDWYQLDMQISRVKTISFVIFKTTRG